MSQPSFDHKIGYEPCGDEFQRGKSTYIRTYMCTYTHDEIGKNKIQNSAFPFFSFSLFFFFSMMMLMLMMEIVLHTNTVRYDSVDRMKRRQGKGNKIAYLPGTGFVNMFW